MDALIVLFAALAALIWIDTANVPFDGAGEQLMDHLILG